MALANVQVAPAKIDSSPVDDVSRLTTRAKFAYGFAEMPLQVATLAILVYVPNYYGMDLGISLAAVGTVLLVARLFDAVTDPLIGYLSDRTRSPWGRRRIWMLASIPILMLAFWKLFFPAPPVGAGYLLIWMGMLWLGWTMLQIPYYAWGAELSTDYNERSEIVGWRTATGLVANVLSKLLPSAALFFFAYGGTRQVLEIIGYTLLFMTPLAVLLTTTFTPESTKFRPVSMPIWKGLRLIWTNGPFKRILFAFFLTNIGAALGTTTTLFYMRGVLGEESAGIVMLMIYYLTSLCGVPFWVRLSARIGKHRAIVLSYLSFWACGFYMLLGRGDIKWVIPIMVFMGFCASALWVLPNSMKADVIDVDALRCGENRAAWFFALWSFVVKLAQSVGPWLALLLLTWSGFDASPKAMNSPEQLLGLRLLYSFGTPIFYTLAALLFLNYPLTEARQKRMRLALQRRQHARGSKK